MTANSGTFEAIIKTIDQSSSPMRAITARLAEMTGATEAASREMAKLERPHMFARMGDHVSTLRTRFEGLGSSIGGVHGRVSKLLPALGSLAALTSIGGIFGVVNAVAERRADAVARIDRLGVDPKRLGVLSAAAKAGRVSTDDLDTAISKMSSNIFDASSGKNKDVADIFAHLKIKMKENGHFRDTAEIMQQFFDVFHRTKDGDMRTKIAKALMGKSGDAVLPMFMLQKEELDSIAEASKGLGYGFSPEETKNLKEYTRQMNYLNAAVGSVTNAIGAKLDPILAPVAKKMREFLVNHRDDIANRVETVVKRLQKGLESADWDKIQRHIEAVWTAVSGAIEAVGGFTNAIEIMIAWKVGSWALSFAGGLIKVAREAKATALALLGVRDAAVAADSSTAFGGLLGRLALISRYLTGIGTFMAIMWPSSTASPEQDETPHPDGKPRGKDDSAKLSRQVYEESRRPHWVWNMAPQPKLPKGPLPAPVISFDLPQDKSSVPIPGGIPTFGPSLPAWSLPGGSGSRFPTSLFPSDADGSDGRASGGKANGGEAGGGKAGGGELKIKIDVSNLPPGGRVDVDHSRIPYPVETDVGWNYPMGKY